MPRLLDDSVATNLRSERLKAVSLPAAAAMTVAAVIAGNFWDRVSPDPIAYFSALVQTGFPTRFVLLCLFFIFAFALYLFRTFRRGWYGYVECIAGLAIGWSMIGCLAIQIQSSYVIGLVSGGYLLSRGLVNVQEGRLSAAAPSLD